MTDDRGKPRVQHWKPPLTWLWDLYPLVDGAWGNVRGFSVARTGCVDTSIAGCFHA